MKLKSSNLHFGLLILFQGGKVSALKKEQVDKSHEAKSPDIIEGEFHREDKKNNEDL